MFKQRWAFAATLCVVAVCGTSAQAAVKSYNLGSLPVDDTSIYSGTTGTGHFTVYEKFSVGTVPVTASVSYADTVRFATNAITGGILSLYSCLAKCTSVGSGAGFAPTAGALLASAPILNMTSTSQSAGFGPVTLAAASAYFLQISGNTAGFRSPNGVTYTGTISLDSVGGVPEPSTWAMMLIGFAGLAYAVGRKQTSGTTALRTA